MTHLVQQLLDNLELLLCEITGIYALDLPTELCELGSIRAWREGKGSDLNAGHRGVVV